MRRELGSPETVIAKPLHGDNGVGIHVFGRDPRTGETAFPIDDLEAWCESIERYGDLVVQEYVASVRNPGDVRDLAAVPLDRRDFGEVRFILVDGELPPLPNGEPCLIVDRVLDSLERQIALRQRPAALEPAARAG